MIGLENSYTINPVNLPIEGNTRFAQTSTSSDFLDVGDEKFNSVDAHSTKSDSLSCRGAGVGLHNKTYPATLRP